MFMRKTPFALLLLVAFGAGTALAETPGLGKPINEADIAAWNIEVLPDGLATRQRYGDAGCRGLFAEMRHVSRRERRQSRGRHVALGRSQQVRPHRYDEDRPLLQICHDAVRRHPALDALPDAENVD